MLTCDGCGLTSDEVRGVGHYQIELTSGGCRTLLPSIDICDDCKRFFSHDFLKYVKQAGKEKMAWIDSFKHEPGYLRSKSKKPKRKSPQG